MITAFRHSNFVTDDHTPGDATLERRLIRARLHVQSHPGPRSAAPEDRFRNPELLEGCINVVSLRRAVGAALAVNTTAFCLVLSVTHPCIGD